MKNDIPPNPAETGVADEVLREVWRIKDELSAAYGHSLDRLFAEARERQRQSGRPSVNFEKQNKRNAV
ncbi:MAG TPA: hypothetical protein VFC44_14905 [Candidatus Saccharimonadales bacterium]|nr:hypothetical protein [Candidatus Saccharimonadales bacterium]